MPSARAPHFLPGGKLVPFLSLSPDLAQRQAWAVALDKAATILKVGGKNKGGKPPQAQHKGDGEHNWFTCRLNAKQLLTVKVLKTI